MATLSAADLLDVAYTMMIDSATWGTETTMDKVEEFLATAVVQTDETFGTDPRAQRETRAVMDLLGGPAPLVDREADTASDHR